MTTSRWTHPSTQVWQLSRSVWWCKSKPIIRKNIPLYSAWLLQLIRTVCCYLLHRTRWCSFFLEKTGKENNYRKRKCFCICCTYTKKRLCLFSCIHCVEYLIQTWWIRYQFVNIWILKHSWQGCAIPIKNPSIHLYLSITNGRKVTVELNDGKWHHICATWESTSGNWQVYIDGRIHGQGTNLAAGKSIANNGIAIIGQDQDSMGGGFQQHQSFFGSLTSISLWDRVLSPHDGSFSFLTNFECHTQPGQVLRWEDMLKGEWHGEVKVL